MKAYQYKLQWLFYKSEIRTAIKLFGATNLSAIHIRDINLKVLHSFMNPHRNNPQTINKDVIKCISKIKNVCTLSFCKSNTTAI